MNALRQVFRVPNALLGDCYYIVNQARPDEAMNLYYSLAKEVEDAGHPMFVFDGTHYPIGFIKGHKLFNKNCMHVDYLFVDKRYQRTGIGTALIQAYEDFCRKNNFESIQLYSAPTVQAKNFYLKQGFKLAGPNNMLMQKTLKNR